VPGGVATDPSNADRIFYVAGGNLVSASLSSTGQQTFFRGQGHELTLVTFQLVDLSIFEVLY